MYLRHVCKFAGAIHAELLELAVAFFIVTLPFWRRFGPFSEFFVFFVSWLCE